MRALYAASTGMQAQELNVQVISNNIANLRTTGYKRQRAQFQDLLYDTLRRPGTNTSDQTQVPSGIQIGAGVKTASTARVMSQGVLTPTEQQYDVAIRGEGFFQVTLPDGRTAYTRDGSFEVDGTTGNLVTHDGYQLVGPNAIPTNAISVSISPTGQVQATLSTTSAPSAIGQFQLARFVNKAGLEAIGDNLFLETNASGAPTTGNPSSDGFGSLQQSYLEEANVNAVTEISSLIAAQRAYEMNAKVVTATDQMLATTSQMFRG